VSGVHELDVLAEQQVESVSKFKDEFDDEDDIESVLSL